MPVPAIIGGFLKAGTRLAATGSRLMASGRRAVSATARAAAPTRRTVSGGGRGRIASAPPGGGGAAPAVRATPAEHTDPMHAAARQTKLEKLWTLDSAQNLFARLNTLVGENTPSFVHTITVSVIGGPTADLRRVWYLACAAAFGRYRNRVSSVGSVNMEAVWDVTGKAVQVTIGYVKSGLVDQGVGLAQRAARSRTNLAIIVSPGAAVSSYLGEVIGGAIAGPAAAPVVVPVGRGRTALTAVQFLQVGPDQVTIGGTWPDFLSAASTKVATAEETIPPAGVTRAFEPCAPVVVESYGLVEKFVENSTVDVLGELPVDGSAGVTAPWGRTSPPGGASLNTASFRSYDETGPSSHAATLPDDGRIITTGEVRSPSVQPPKPVVDGKSRTSAIAAIHAALHDPCHAPERLPCMPSPLYSDGVPVYRAGLGLEDDWRTGGRAFSAAVAAAARPGRAPTPTVVEPALTE